MVVVVFVYVKINNSIYIVVQVQNECSTYMKILKLSSFSKDYTIFVSNSYSDRSFKNWSKFVCNLVLTSRSKDEEIELVTLDDFYKTAPSDISRTVSVIVTYIL